MGTRREAAQGHHGQDEHMRCIQNWMDLGEGAQRVESSGKTPAGDPGLVLLPRA